MAKFEKKKDKGGRKSGTKNRTMKPVEFCPDMIYTVEQTAAILQVAIRTVRNFVKRGELPASNTPAGLRIKGVWIDEYLNKAVMFKGEEA